MSSSPTTNPTSSSSPSSTTSYSGSRTSTPLPLLTTFVVLSSLLLLLCAPTPAVSVSLLETLKGTGAEARTYQQCPNMVVSAICYHCAALDPTSFHDIHDLCCGMDGRVRQLCRDWYTEEPKRGRRDAWYY